MAKADSGQGQCGAQQAAVAKPAHQRLAGRPAFIEAEVVAVTNAAIDHHIPSIGIKRRQLTCKAAIGIGFAQGNAAVAVMGFQPHRSVR